MFRFFFLKTQADFKLIIEARKRICHTDEDGQHLKDEDESGMRLCTFWCKVFESRSEGERHHSHETLLEYVQKAPEDIQWVIDKREFDEIIATKKESAPGPDGIP